MRDKTAGMLLRPDWGLALSLREGPRLALRSTGWLASGPQPYSKTWLSISKKYVQVPYVNSEEWIKVVRLADQLWDHLNSPDAAKQINAANQPGQSSAVIQATFGDFAHELGFENEKTGLFFEVELALRPDYFVGLEIQVSLLEVERGKTTINNMDLLDFWKCHVCTHAHYLFLLVPKDLRQNSTMPPRNEFLAVSRRLSKFFTPSTYTNVRGLCLFGY